MKHLRKNRKWSQVDLAAKLGNNFQNISSLERGEFNPTLFSVDNIAKAFEMTLTDFINGFENLLFE